MQIEIKDELVERLKRLREQFENKSPVKFDTVGGEINALIEWAIERDERKLGLAPKEQVEEHELLIPATFRIKAWIPAEVDPEEDTQYTTKEDAEKEKAQLEEMQPENIYEIEEVEAER